MMYTLKYKDKVFRINLEQEENKFQIEIDNEPHPVEFRKLDEHLYSIISNGKSFSIGVLKNGKDIQVFLNGDLYEFEAISERERSKVLTAASGVQEIKSPMPSRVVKILKTLGDEVKLDEGVVVVEAMKMESELKSPINGTVKDIKTKEGDSVEAGTVLLIISSE